jgi:hypothetical protein
MHDRTFARFQRGAWRGTISTMDSFGMVVIALGAFALLEVAAANLRGQERSRRTRRSIRPTTR